MDIGGKLLTNHLATLVSFRQWNMLDQTHIVNDVKEQCCYVSLSFSSDLERCRWEWLSSYRNISAEIVYFSSRLSGNAKGVNLEYVLPDFSRNRHGYIRDKPIPTVEPSINMGREDSEKIDQNAISHPGQGYRPEKMTDTHAQEEAIMSHEGPPNSDSDQILFMSNERFTVPELVFNPSDIGWLFFWFCDESPCCCLCLT